MHMRLLVLLLPLYVSASWFSSDSSAAYNSWSDKELSGWLHDHSVNVPTAAAKNRDELIALVEKNWDSASTWSQNQYNDAQKTFASIREDTFSTWDESQLRSWLLEQGVIAPKNKKEELLVLAKQRYHSYQSAASRWGEWATNTGSAATASVQSFAATATNEAERVLDDSKDYVYSTWDDNKLRTYLEDKGVIKTKSEQKRDELLALMRNSYSDVSDPIWNSWSTSYIHNWLVSHNLISPTPSATEQMRDNLVKQMKKYYYTTNSYVWDTWTDSDLRQWLIDNGVIKSEAQATREKMVKLITDNYNNAASTITSTWSESQMEEWLIDHDYITASDAAKANREELAKLVKEKYSSTSDATTKAVAPYHYSFVTWSDTRLRAYLREAGVPEKYIPRRRQTLLERTAEIFTPATPSLFRRRSTAEKERDELYAKIQKIINSKTSQAEEQLASIRDTLTVYSANAKRDAVKATGSVKKETAKSTEKAKAKVSQYTDEL